MLEPRVRTLVLALLAGLVAVAHAAPPAPGKRGRTAPPHAVSRHRLAQAAARLGSRADLLRTKPAAPDSVRLVALRIDFPDLAFGASPPADELHDRFYYETQFRYLSQYWDAASTGRLRLAVDVPDLVVRATRPAEAYGDVAAYDSLMVALAGRAIAGSDAAVDFSRYDGVVIVHAGPGQESDVAGDSPAQIWSGFLDEDTFREQLSTPDSLAVGIPTADGTQVRDAIVLPEWEVQDLGATNNTRLGSLGVYAHEIGQWLGLVPLFDATPSPVPDSQGLGNFDLMGYGLWVANGWIPSLPSSFNRMLLGWVEPREVHGDIRLVLRDQERGAADSTVALVRISEREYFLVSYVLEDPGGPRADRPCSLGVCLDTLVRRRFFDFDNRDASCCFGYEDANGDSVLSSGDTIDTYAGAEWDFFMTDFEGRTAGEGSGLLVLHVDEQVLQDVLASGSTNVQGDPRRKAVDVEEADGIEDLDRIPDNARGFGSADDYFVAGRPFGPGSIPDTRSADGAPTGIEIAWAGFADSTRSRVLVDVRFTARTASAAAPRRRATRSIVGRAGSDLVALPLADGSAALVLAADSGAVFLADARLDEAPVSDGDSTTLRPWAVVPPELRGDWVGPPAVGDVDGDGAPDVVLAVAADSLGSPRARLFAWRLDGRELRHLDGDPLSNSGLLASFAGIPSAPLLFDFDADGGDDVVCACQRDDSSSVCMVRSRAGGTWETWFSRGETGATSGGPIVVQGSDPNRWAVAWSAGAADTAGAPPGQTLYFVPPGALPVDNACVELEGAPAGAMRLATANLDGRDAHELVAAAEDGTVWILPLEPASFAATGCRAEPPSARLGTNGVAPLALADVDGDGTVEILLAAGTAQHVLSATGAEMAGWPYSFRVDPGLERAVEPARGAGSPLAADLDGDGRVELALHLPGGSWLVWNGAGRRRHELEAALPAGSIGTPLLADLDGDARLDLAAAGRFQASVRYLSRVDSLATEQRTHIAVWSLPEAGEVAWGQYGRGPGHAFLDATTRTVRRGANDAGEFVVGPNPAGREVQARIPLRSDATVRCRLFDLEGECVREAVRHGVAGTVVEFRFDLGGLPPGVYLATMELSSGGRRTRPLAVVR